MRATNGAEGSYLAQPSGLLIMNSSDQMCDMKKKEEKSQRADIDVVLER